MNIVRRFVAIVFTAFFAFGATSSFAAEAGGGSGGGSGGGARILYGTITLNDIGETIPSSPSVIFEYTTGYEDVNGNTITSITPPTRTGYTYGGHFTRGNICNGGDCIAIGADGVIVSNLYDVFGTNQYQADVYAFWDPKIITVTLNHQGANTNGSPSTVYLKYGTGWYSNSGASTSITQLSTVPTKNNYTFGGYYTGTNGSGVQVIDSLGHFKTTFAALHALSSNGTIYAYWVSSSASTIYTVTLQPNNKNQSNTDQFIYVKTNVDWYADSRGRTPIYASIFDDLADGGAGLLVPQPQNSSQHFNGYWTSTQNPVQATDRYGNILIAPTFAANTKLVAHWDASWSELMFDYDDGESTSCVADGIFAVYGEDMPALDPCAMAVPPTGYTFNGFWDDNVSPSVQYYTPSLESARVWNQTSSPVVLTAHYSPALYTVTYRCGTGTGTPPAAELATYGAAFTAAANTCTKSGYVFAGWLPRGESNVWVDGNIWQFTEGKSFDAQWRTATYNINYVLNGGTNYAGAPATYTAGVGATISGTPTRDNSTFGGWCTDSGLTTCSNTQTIASNETGDKTFYAKWTCNNGYSVGGGSTTCNPNILTLDWDENGGGAVSNDTCRYGGKIVLPAAPTRTGYTFTKWKLADGTLKDASSTVTGGCIYTYTNAYSGTSTAIQAQWTANTDTAYQVYHYTKNTTGSAYTQNGTVDNLTGTSDASLTLANLTRSITGFTYDKGFAGTAASGTTIPASGSVTTTTILPDGTRVISLYYNRNSYSISYTMNGGTNYSGAPESYTYGVGATISGTPTRDNSTFGGWCRDSGLTTCSASQSVSASATGDKTFYAKWTCNAGYTANSGNTACSGNTITLNWNENGGGAIDNGSCTYGGNLVLPAAPTRAGYTLTKWKLADGTLKDASSTVTGGCTYTYTNAYSGTSTAIQAQWSANTDTAYKVYHYTKNTTGDSYTQNGSVDNLTGTTDSSLTLANLARSLTGFTYDKGFAGTAATGTTIPSSGSVTTTTILPDGTRVISLYYNRNSYSISYTMNGGTNYSGAPEGYTYGVGATISGTPTRDNSTFGGWCTDSGLTTCSASQSVSASATGDKTFYAKWTCNAGYAPNSGNTSCASNNYTITLDNAYATTNGSTTLYTKYQTEVYKDSSRTQVMSPLENPIVIPQRAYTVSYNAHDGNVNTTTANTASVYSFDGYYNTANSGGTQLIGSQGLDASISSTSDCFHAVGTGFGQGTCSDTLYNSLENGDWGAVFPYGEIKGTSFCYGTSGGFYVYSQDPIIPNSSTQSTIQSAYNSWVANNRPEFSDFTMGCYCKLQNPNSATSPWVYIGKVGSEYPMACDAACPMYCGGLAYDTEYYPTVAPAYRTNLFSGLPSGGAKGYLTGAGRTAGISYTDTSHVWYARWSGGSVTLPNATRTGYDFLGWYASTDANAIRFGGAGDSYTPTANVTLHAKWSTNTYTISYVMNGGTNYSGAPESYTYGVGATIDGTPTRANSTFGGWCTDSGLTTCSASQSISASATGDKTFYAKWTCNAGYAPNSGNTACGTSSYTVSYNCGTGGGTAPSDGTATYNAAFTAATNTCTNPNYTFAGWLPEGESSTWVNGTAWPYNTNKTFIAQWTPNSYSVTLNDGSATTTGTPHTMYVKYGTGWYTDAGLQNSIATLTRLPELQGKVFVGYFTQQDGAGTMVVNSLGAILTTTAVTSSNAVLYAFFMEPKFTVTTTPLAANTPFMFGLSARGTFYVDWGDGTVDQIVRPNSTASVEAYTHTYSTAGVKEIRFSGAATKYGSNSAIIFGASKYPSIDGWSTNTKDLIASISGSLGAIFPTIGNSSPSFFCAFRGAGNLHGAIPSGLFTGVTKPKVSMFNGIFSGVHGAVSIPSGLFSDLSGSFQSDMFNSAFTGSAIREIPEKLFGDNLTGSAAAAFASMFSGNGCLQSIPADLFRNVTGPNDTIFRMTFGSIGTGTIVSNGQTVVNCNTLYPDADYSVPQGYIPPHLFDGLNGSTASNFMQDVFKDSNLYTTCPYGTQSYDPYNYQQYWDGRVACIKTPYAITLKNQNGTSTDATVYEQYNEGWYSDNNWENSISGVSVPTRSGYTFRGYYTATQSDLTSSGGTGTQKIGKTGTLPSNTTFTADTTLYSAWAANCTQPSHGTCTLTINNDGTATYAASCNTGYTLSGNGTSTPTCTPNTLTIAFDANTGTGTCSNVTCQYDGACSAQTWNSTNCALSNGGKVLTGWNAAANGTGTSYALGANIQNIVSNGTKTLYAVWTTPTCNVTHGTGGVANNTTNTPTCSVTCDSGYSTSGTYTGTQNGTSVSYSCTPNNYTITLDNGSATTNGTATLYTTKDTNVYRNSGRTEVMSTSANPITKPSRVYTVSYEAHSGSVSPSSTNTTATYTFNGYYSAASNGTQYISSNGNITANGISAGKGYTSNSNTWNAQWTSGSVTLATPSRAGYTFNGWYTAATGGTRRGGAGDSYTPTADETLHAQWTANTDTAYKVYHYTKNTTGSAYTQNGNVDNLTGTSDASLTLANLTRSITGFTYDKGFAGTAASGTTIPASGSVTTTTILPDGTRVISLYYNRNSYSISYTMNGGTNYSGAPESYTYGVGATISGTPTRDNSTFGGWCTDSGLTSCATTQTIPTTATGNKTFYAKWTCNSGYTANSGNTACSGNTITLNWNENGGGAIDNGSCTYGGNLVLPAAPTRAGYTFTKWKLADGTLKDASSTVTGGCIYTYTNAYSGTSTAIQAQWSANTDTAYKVYHYTKNTTGSAYTQNGNVDNLTGTSDASLTLANLTRSITGFTYDKGFAGTAASGTTIPASGSVTTTTILPDGTRVISLYYNRNSYNCAAGTYLPAGATACDTCLAGQYCAANIWTFNETLDQGLASCATGTNNLYSNSAAGAGTVNDCYLTLTPGKYVATAGAGQTNCAENGYCPGAIDIYYGGSVAGHPTTGGRTACGTGLYAPAGMWESAQCGKILHVGDQAVYLRSAKRTTPSLNVDIDHDGTPDFFGNMSTLNLPMTSASDRGLKLRYNNTTYSLYDDTVSTGL